MEKIQFPFYPSEGENECFRSSLANLLLCHSDGETAQQVYDAYYDHELVLESGLVHIGTLSKLVIDLTKGRYTAINYLCQEMLDVYDSAFRPIEDSINEALVKEEHAKRLALVSEEVLNIELPGVFVVGQMPRRGTLIATHRGIVGNTPILNEARMNHAIVAIGRGTYIDNGNIVQYVQEGITPLRSYLRISRMPQD